MSLSPHFRKRFEELLKTQSKATATLLKRRMEVTARETELACRHATVKPLEASLESLGAVRFTVRLKMDDTTEVVESTVISLDSCLPIDLSEKCSHDVDWDSLDRDWACPRVTCQRCGKAGAWMETEFIWGTVVDDTFRPDDARYTEEGT